MTQRNFLLHRHRSRGRTPDLFYSSIFLVIFVSLLPTVVLLIISYFQALASARANLQGIINTATIKTDRLLEDADAILHRAKVDLQNTDTQTAVRILQRQIYNDFRFREAGIINTEGLLILSSLGVVDPPIPASPLKARINPDDPNLQIIGLGRTQIMQEQSVVLMLRGSGHSLLRGTATEPAVTVGQIGGIYLLVDPDVLESFLEAIPDLDLGSNGFIIFITEDRQLLSAIGTPPQDILSNLQNLDNQQLRVSRTTKDSNITIVGKLDRTWVLRDWWREFIVGAPLTVMISGVLSYLFIRQLRQVSSLDYELRRGLAANEFEVHYQPIIDLQTRQCVGAEALLRWRHPQRGLIYPGLFIPLAEKTGFIVPMTEWLIERVIQDQANLEARFQNLYTAINLSPTQLNKGDVDRLVQMLRGENNRFKANITFEITENKLVEERGQVVQDAIARLKLWGSRVAIDDFGTGYSNIGYLQRLELDQLKLDRLFIKRIELGIGTNATQIVDSLIDFGTRIDLTIVAEGIETETQCQYLRERGVHFGQGWLFSRPLPLKDFERFLQNV